MTLMESRQCARCVMDTSDVDISFDQDGYCNHCRDFFERTSKNIYQGKLSDKQLEQIVEKIKKAGKNNKYDCVIGISGGVDSCYAAYIAKKFGLRPLLVHLDNGWNSEISVKNIKNIADKLAMDYQSYVLDWNEFRDLQLAFLKASIPEIETPTDIAIPVALHKIAAQHRIKYIISGGNYVTEGILPKTWHYNAKDTVYFRYIQKRYGLQKLKTFALFGWKEEAYYKVIRGIRMIYILNYVPYSKNDAVKLLEQDLGWKYYGGKHYESKYTGFVQSYILPEKFNIDYRKATLSTQICAGTVTREDALKELAEKPYDRKKIEVEKEYVCKKLGISPEEFNAMMKLPPKLYRDYPNDERKLKCIYTVYKKIYK